MSFSHAARCWLERSRRGSSGLGCAPPGATMVMRLVYVDDSGARETALATYSWISMDVRQWNRCLRQVIDWRRDLWRRHLVPVDFELHATKFLNGRGEPSSAPGWLRDKKGNARAVAQEALELIASLVDEGVVELGTVYGHAAPDTRWASHRGEIYEALLLSLDAGLRQDGDHAMVVMDGDGSDPAYRRAHRRLPLAERAIIEDPAFQPAHESQLVQLADLVAYVTYQHLLAHPGKAWAHRWFPEHLQAGHGLRLLHHRDVAAPSAPPEPTSPDR